MAAGLRYYIQNHNVNDVFKVRGPNWHSFAPLASPTCAPLHSEQQCQTMCSKFGGRIGPRSPLSPAQLVPHYILNNNAKRCGQSSGAELALVRPFRQPNLGPTTFRITMSAMCSKFGGRIGTRSPLSPAQLVPHCILNNNAKRCVQSSGAELALVRPSRQPNLCPTAF